MTIPTPPCTARHDSSLPNPIPQSVLLRRFTVMLAGWAVVTSAANLLLPADPTDAWFDIMVIAPIVVLPAAFAAAYLTRPRFRATVLALDFSAITAVQGMRIAGIAMLSLWAAGVMNPLFALWAGGIDVFIGLTAVTLAYLIANRRSVPRLVLRSWHSIGLLDFVVAVPLGLIATPSALRVLTTDPSTYEMFSFPLSFIPMVGVPFMIVMHLIGLLQLRRHCTPTAGPLVHALPADLVGRSELAR